MFASIVVALACATWNEAAAVAAPDEYVITGRFVLPTETTVPAVRRDRVFGRVDWSHGPFGDSGSQEIEWPIGPDGRFRATFPRARDSVVLEFWFELRDELGGFETGFHVGMPLNEETGEPDSDRVELGELAFPVARTVAIGQIVDRAGRGIAGAQVGLSGSFPRASEDSDSTELRAPITEFQRIRSVAAADGTFRLRCPFPALGCGIDVAAEGYFAEAVDAAGADPRTIRLVAMSRVSGRVEFEKFDGQQALIAEVQPRYGLGQAYSESASVAADGSFVIGELRPAVYDLVLRVRGVDDAQPESLCELDGIVVAEGKSVTNPRLQELSFRRRAHAIRIHVENPDGSSESEDPDDDSRPSGELVGFDARGRRTVWSAELIHGVATVRPVVDVDRIEVRVEGFRNERIDDLSHDATVRLRKGIPIKVVVLPEHLPCLLRSSLSPVGEAARWYHRSAETAFDNDEWFGVFRSPTNSTPPGMANAGDKESPTIPNPDEDADPASEPEEVSKPSRPDSHPGVLFFTAGAPGRYELHLWNHGDDTLIAIPREAAVIEVKDCADLQVFEIHVDPADVRALHEK